MSGEALQALAWLFAAAVVVSVGVFLSALATRRVFHAQEESRIVSVRETFRELREVGHQARKRLGL